MNDPIIKNYTHEAETLHGSLGITEERSKEIHALIAEAWKNRPEPFSSSDIHSLVASIPTTAEEAYFVGSWIGGWLEYNRKRSDPFQDAVQSIISKYGNKQ